MGKAANQGLAIQFLEFVEFGAIDQARDDVMDVERLAPVGGHHAIDFLGANSGSRGSRMFNAARCGGFRVATMRRAIPIAWLSFWA